MAIVGATTACSSLLPRSQERTDMPWSDFQSARAAVDAIEPGKTQLQELMSDGFEPQNNPAVSWLSWPELIQRFAALGALQASKIDPGLRECLTIPDRCRALAVDARKLRRERLGNFWADSLAFRRTIRTTGWTFNALIVIVDGQVVFRSHGGQPRLEQTVILENPLGPFQGWGGAVGAVAIQ
jgi:hypothetical protein